MHRQSPTFKATRDKVARLIEADKLRRSLQEFFENQSRFHAGMKNFVVMCRGVIETLPTHEERDILKTILAPYEVLLNNPFQSAASHHPEDDIAHIESVIAQRSANFETTMEALVSSASTQGRFHQLLDKLKQDPVMKDVMQSTAQASSWMEVTGMIDWPFQNLMRYELMMKSISAVLTELGVDSKVPALSGIMNVLARITPELAYINEHHSELVKLLEIDELVQRLGKIKSMPVADCLPGEDEKARLTLANKIKAVRLYIDDARQQIARRQADILVIYTGLIDMLERLATGMQVSLYEDQYSYSSLAYSGLVSVSETLFGENGFFQRPTEDPREALTRITGELKEQCARIDGIRETERRLLEKAIKP